MLVLSDVCDTLIDLNSTYDYIKFLCNHNYGNKVLGNLLSNRSFIFFSYIIFKFTGYDLQRKLTPLFFKGMKVPDLSEVNQDFQKFYLSKKTKVLDKLIDYKRKGNKIILVSASINPPIEMLGNYLGIDYYSSILDENSEGRYTGKFQRDLLGDKQSLLRSKDLNIDDYNKIAFYTDNLSDIGFIKAIQNLSNNSKFYLILKGDETKNKWLKLLHSNNIINYEFIS